MAEERIEQHGSNEGSGNTSADGTTSAAARLAFTHSPQTQQILEILSNDAFREDAQVSELLTKVRESVSEISANRKPRKRARLRDSVDWTTQDLPEDVEPINPINPMEHRQLVTDMEIVEDEIDRHLNISTSGKEDLMKLAAGLLEGDDGAVRELSSNIPTFALNAVVVLAKAALKRDGEKHNAKALQDTLEKMHLQYTALANECTCLQDKLKNEKELCSVLEKDVSKIRSNILHLQGENEHLKGAVTQLETQLTHTVQCQICYEEKRNNEMKIF